ncbi:hypothetical protein DFH07DRAFT_790295 [Mycena maculata]|uniref:Zn(2)-C6 fungal-type domain-containing protein n=1 Tax=Mycena maculata TaxID=230809 RepID=A0AAD7KBM8_9AGAR|nr:hypothetical protein DFH07DRAFT_790295 [Mycena maculata]
MSLVEGTKKRRLRGACDICRRQKIRCDSAKMPGNRCSNCVSFNSECTHNLSQLKSQQEDKVPRRKRTANQQSMPPTNEMAAAESTRSLKTANLVDGLLGGTYHAPQDRETLLQLLLEVSRYAKGLEGELDAYRQAQSPSDRTSSTAVSPKSNDADAEEDLGEVVDIEKLPEHIKRITMDAANHRFFGKNSSMLFVREAYRRNSSNNDTSTPRLTRPQFWTTQPWEVSAVEAPVIQKFPPPDLLRDLVEIYFTQLNIYTFLMHRPTFERSIADGLHLRDPRFGATVLGVCALASKNSPDKRVLLPGSHNELSAGYEWFQQIQRPFSGHSVETTSVYDLQLCCLYILFRQTGSDLESCWLLTGIGILHAQDIGAHLHLDSNGQLSVEHEISKRSSSFLSVFDAIVSACFGRLRVAATTGCDLHLPFPCDDQYWESEDPEKAFKQPPGKPALAEYYIAYIRLVKIFTFSWRKDASVLDYTGKKPLGPEVIAELDSRLNKWAEEIPEHLLWNPYMEDDLFFDQSAALYSAYYHVQILIHRPFIRTRADQAPSSSTFRSLAICAAAARSCSHVVDVKSRRGFFPNSHTVKAAFDSAIVLLLNLSGGTRGGLSLDTDRELVDVYKCMGLLHQSERRWQNAGRFYDIICELMNAHNLPLPTFPPLDIPFGQWCADPGSHKPLTVPEQNANNLDSWPEHFLTLPMAVEDLGRLPIYGSLEFPDMNLDKFIPDSIPTTTEAVDGFPVSNLYDPSNPSHTSDEMMDSYLSHWIPYFSGVDGMAQALHGSSGN